MAVPEAARPRHQTQVPVASADHLTTSGKDSQPRTVDVWASLAFSQSTSQRRNRRRITRRNDRRWANAVHALSIVAKRRPVKGFAGA
jgi:hypothetical protein